MYVLVGCAVYALFQTDLALVVSSPTERLRYMSVVDQCIQM